MPSEAKHAALMSHAWAPLSLTLDLIRHRLQASQQILRATDMSELSRTKRVKAWNEINMKMPIDSKSVACQLRPFY